MTLSDMAFGVHERICSGLAGFLRTGEAQIKGLLLPGVPAEDKCELKSTSRPTYVCGFISCEAKNESLAPPTSLCASPGPSGVLSVWPNWSGLSPFPCFATWESTHTTVPFSLLTVPFSF